MKIALITDWLVTYAGAERVIEQMIACFPEADIFAVVDFVPPAQRAFLHGKTVKTTFIQKMPWAKKCYRHYLPLMPLAIEQLDLSAYDVILSSSHAVAKGVITGPNQVHISYVHSPMRYAWDLQAQYLQESNVTRGLKSWITRYLLHRLRIWDYVSSARVDYFIANSNYIARRIQKVYRRDATVIYPPVNIGLESAAESFPTKGRGPTGGWVPEEGKLCVALEESYYVVASRLVPYKKIPLIVEAFKAMPDKKLIVIGDGPELGKVKAIGASNVEILGYQPTFVLKEYLAKAKGFVFAAIEDFGITIVEALAAGTPVIAYKEGGAVEIVTEKTGVLYAEQSVEAIVEAVNHFETLMFNADVCKESVKKFSIETFRKKFSEYVKNVIQK